MCLAEVSVLLKECQLVFSGGNATSCSGVISNVWLWPNPAVRLSIVGCQGENLAAASAGCIRRNADILRTRPTGISSLLQRFNLSRIEKLLTLWEQEG